MQRRYIQNFSKLGVLHVFASFGILLICSNALLLWNFHTPLERVLKDKDKPRGHQSSSHIVVDYEPAKQRAHPIDALMANAETRFQALLSGQTDDLQSAAQSYRARRGTHPPPGFNAWYEYARNHNAVFIEELFDQIYHDLTPFWGIPAKDTRDFARHFDHRIYVRNGIANMTTNHGQGTPKDRLETWLSAIQDIRGFLPDLDMAINIMDESRVIVPSEDINRYIQIESQNRKMIPVDKVISQYQGLNASHKEAEVPPQVAWIGPGDEPFWDTARVGCGAQAPGRLVASATNFTGPPHMPSGFPKRSFEGYVKNWTWARDPCQQPHLQEAHGTFIEPVSMSTTRALVPIFGESKLSMNNDILIPPAAYLSESFSSGLYSAKNGHGGDWSKKTAGAVWRGVASGGRNREENWTRFHRHRFVSMLNGSCVRTIETSPQAVGEGQNFVLQSYATYHLTATKYMDLGTWLSRIANVGFTNLLCWPPTDLPTCNYTSLYFKIASKLKMSKQYDYKFLPDVDGNSFSGRYLAFLRSTSVPIKATIYSEWHDDRLIPWLHFVPMDNSFVDIYGILDYFLGTGDNFRQDDGEVVTDGSHDDAAKKIALRGKGWAEKVLRKEDMQIYMLRLLLEYARLCDDNRERLGYVEDLKEEKPVLPWGLDSRVS